MKYFALFFLIITSQFTFAQEPSKTKFKKNSRDLTSDVNVFLGSSGDHGQLSPAASYPFSMLSIGPQTYPNLHAGYEHSAKQFLGFTHNRFEGVGCTGSGGNLMIKPYLGNDPAKGELIKSKEQASPGYYSVGFENKMTAEMVVYKNQGMHRYRMPQGEKGFAIDLGYAFNGAFVAEEHQVQNNAITGMIASKTTCGAGVYRIYYLIEFSKPVKFQSAGDHKFNAVPNAADTELEIKVSFSSTSIDYAKRTLSKLSFDQLKEESKRGWNSHLNRIVVKGDKEREKLFYSLLYRTIQSPYQISEIDGTYKAIDGSTQKAEGIKYNGWAIWDNYRTQLPLLSIAYPERYQDIAGSIANLYTYGKKDYATKFEPSPTVRTEHAVVVVLDAIRKGYKINTGKIIDSLIKEVDHLDYGAPDKALESSYDAWALSEILSIMGKKDAADKYKQKALEYKNYWNKDFKDITKSDVDRMQARKLYQGTIWQYRWFVPFDVKGLTELIGGEKTYLEQLDYFFKNDLYNHANEPDLQVPLMYNTTPQAWKSQKLMHNYAVDTVVQYYFNDNSRGIDPFVDRIYKNTDKAYIRTMDDDAGAMSAWFVLTAAGISPACVGWPVYYLNVPLFETVTFNWENGKSLNIKVQNFSDKNLYIKEVSLNGKKLDRNWITQKEIMDGGTLDITATDQPQENKNAWISDINRKAVQ
ncbi:glycoside hydrolase domain-containing protein [Pedobacter frigoris]|uniref:Glycoside hydrolase family 92 protein n=1 Tax=Pedobacter frigoris TaxID=2571272 RepID=A0A4V5NZU0_9SPHI|nr:glycoside hydrolase domain-containing protein [Pedobacter frigoris]TKC09112.1 glycoside hydrolase family 92 protein [Pedobacter frigoris]